MNYKNFEELPIWQQAREIVNFIYKIIGGNEALKKDQRLTNQLKGAGISIMNNIPEGFDSDNNVEFIRFLKYSQRSCSEVMSMSYILNDIYGIKKDSRTLYKKVLEERKQIKGFIKYLKSVKK
ncbi:MAG: four helix bundle protein [Melioribacteraceae bacterium]|nr:four helix bundle protein [Melioribacteraceae bacterium]MCZ7604164.1 four helix bundle protein [Melioribacteraceae bacterium]